MIYLFFYAIMHLFPTHCSLLKTLHTAATGDTIILGDIPWKVESRQAFASQSSKSERITLVYHKKMGVLVPYQTRNIFTITKNMNTQKCTVCRELVTESTLTGKIIAGSITLSAALLAKILYSLQP